MDQSNWSANDIFGKSAFVLLGIEKSAAYNIIFQNKVSKRILKKLILVFIYLLQDAQLGKIFVFLKLKTF
jgi:hypothetical protein